LFFRLQILICSSHSVGYNISLYSLFKYNRSFAGIFRIHFQGRKLNRAWNWQAQDRVHQSSYERGNEHSVTSEVAEYLDWVSDYQSLKNDSIPWNLDWVSDYQSLKNDSIPWNVAWVSDYQSLKNDSIPWNIYWVSDYQSLKNDSIPWNIYWVSDYQSLKSYSIPWNLYWVSDYQSLKNDSIPWSW
jgi:hypothetical protein